MIDDLQKVECRHVALDTYELRNPSHTITLTTEGFNHYRTSTLDFETWLDGWSEEESAKYIRLRDDKS